MKNVISVLLIILLVWGVYTVFKKDTYVGFFYPDATNLYVDVMSEEEFESLWECQSWAGVMALEYAQEIMEHGNKYDYECGLNCDLSGGKPYVCEDTLR